MPGPDPDGLDYDEDERGRPRLLTYVRTWHPFWGGGCNRRHRLARARAVLRRLVANGWACVWCRGPVPIWRRVDARFCCEGCRKRCARAHRRARG